MPPPTQALGDSEEGESHDFDQLAKLERTKSCVNAVKKRQVGMKRANDAQNRYQIVELLGKGGFSEVWHAFDLEALTDVAIKIHQLSSAWSDERKSNYIKHAIRENDIQKVWMGESISEWVNGWVNG